ncbi:MAG: DNA polymerase III subunit delta [Nitrospirota bacterium]|jgi:DNA polymerase-3 subunit delta
MPPLLSWLTRAHLADPPPVLLVEGSEARLAQRLVAGLRHLHAEEGAADLSFVRLDGAETDPARVVEECQGLPMLAPRKVVVVEGIAGWRAEDLEDDLLPYVAEPNPSTILVLICTKLDARTRAAKGLRRHALHLTCEAADERQAEQWCRDVARRQGVGLGDPVPRLLVKALGTDLALLESEVAKLSLQVAPGEVIEAGVAEEVVIGQRLPPIWDFIDHVARRERQAALRTLHRFLAEGQHPLGLLSLIARQFRLLIQAKEGLTDNHPRAAVGRDLGLFPSQTEKVLRQATQFSLAELRAAYQRMSIADLDMKGHGLTPRLAIEELVLGLCH